MVKRRIIFNDYDSVVDGRLTLTGWQLSDPVYKANFVSVPGRDGDLDLTTALTDGEPRYNNRTLTATFESSEGTAWSVRNLRRLAAAGRPEGSYYTPGLRGTLSRRKSAGVDNL